MLLRCSCCARLVHPGCLVPPWTDLVSDDWSCYSCKEKTDEYFKARDAYVAELMKRYRIIMIQRRGNVEKYVVSFYTIPNRYEAALERKTKILDIIRSLDLPNNPLDDLIDKVLFLI